MPQLQTRRSCRYCGRKTLHARNVLGAGWGCFLSLFTLGLFIPVWMLMGLWDGVFGTWKCQVCGGRKSV